MGELDDGMDAWGGENIDLPLRVWLFGGRVLNVPCSHIAHYEKRGSRGYRVEWKPIILRNHKRIAEVWWDDYKKYFYYYNPDMAVCLNYLINLLPLCFTLVKSIFIVCQQMV